MFIAIKILAKMICVAKICSSHSLKSLKTCFTLEQKTIKFVILQNQQKLCKPNAKKKQSK